MLVLLFILGICIGSFLNVVIDRIPKNRSIFKGRSYCDYCKKSLSAIELIPIFSFIFLGGKCRNCKKPINVRNIIVELLTGTLFIVSYLTFVDPVKLIFTLFILSSLIAIFFIDLEEGIIPDKITYPAVFLSLVFLISNRQFLIVNLLSGIFAALFFFAIYIATRGRGLGFGDVKLALLLGLFLGFPKIAISVYLAFLTGALVAFILILWRKKVLRDTVPFGPFLVLGAIISHFFGDQLVLLLLNYL